jgi:Helix-turn-helix domain
MAESSPPCPPWSVTTVIRPDVLGVHADFRDLPLGQVLPLTVPGTGEPARRSPRAPQARVGQPVGQVRGVLAEQVIVTTPLDPFLTLRALAGYSGMSPRWLRAQLTDPHHPLPCYRLPGGKILVRRSEFDAWLARYRQVGDPDVERIVRDVLADLR